MATPTREEIAEEARRLRMLRLIVDLTAATLRQSRLTPEEAVRLVSECRRSALELFPGQDETFDMLYRPRFVRILDERFGGPG